jgi:hypothetical protein
VFFEKDFFGKKKNSSKRLGKHLVRKDWGNTKKEKFFEKTGETPLFAAE